MVTYQFVNAEGTTVRREAEGQTTFIPWGPEGPIGGGEAWHEWEDAGRSTPAPYVAPPSPARSIHVAWFRAALADAGKLDAVETAVGTLARSKQILWEYASEVSEADADVKAVAAALKIDLAAIFDAAEALRAARS